MPEEKKATPRAKELAQEKGVDLAAIDGTGEDGQVTVKDVEDAAKAKEESDFAAAGGASSADAKKRGPDKDGPAVEDGAEATEEAVQETVALVKLVSGRVPGTGFAVSYESGGRPRTVTVSKRQTVPMTQADIDAVVAQGGKRYGLKLTDLQVTPYKALPAGKATPPRSSGDVAVARTVATMPGVVPVVPADRPPLMQGHGSTSDVPTETGTGTAGQPVAENQKPSTANPDNQTGGDGPENSPLG